MDKNLSVSGYGICLFSVGVLQDFLKKEKIRTKKLLNKFQKDKPFHDEWEQKLEYGGFNIEIRDSLWISSIGKFHEFDAEGFCGDEVSYRTYDGVTSYSAFKYDVPSGKYLHFPLLR